MNGGINMDREYILQSSGIIKHLNTLVDYQVGGIKEIESLLHDIFNENVDLFLHETLTPEEGPIYHYTSTVYMLPISIYVADYYDSHTIVAVNAGPQATYINEDMKNTIKGAVN
jgi:hypothetical protein